MKKSKVTITKTQSILSITLSTLRSVTFASATRGTVVVLPKGLYEEMGSPTEVTVTIEPGDRLNP